MPETKVKIRPTSNRLLVEREEARDKTDSGLYLPEQSREKPQRAKVIEAGPGKLDDTGCLVEMRVKKGQTVLLSKWAGTEIELDGQKLLFIGEDDVLAVIEE